MDQKSHRIHVRLGRAEFEAEGEQGVVNEQFKMFLEALSRTQDVDTIEKPEPSESESTLTDDNSESADPPDSLTHRVFLFERNLVSLRVLPNGKTSDEDSILLLLLVHFRLRNEHGVSGIQLMKDAKQSGLSIDRIDRVIAPHRDFYHRGGTRKGTRYSLNNQGVTKAEQILQSML